MSLRRKEPETRKEVENAIRELETKLGLEPGQDGFSDCFLMEDLEGLRLTRASMLRLWEVSRPRSEVSLSAWGAV